MRSPDTKSLRFKIWLYFMAFAATILVLLWLLQTAFLGSYYKAMRTRDVINVAQNIKSLYGTTGFQDNLEIQASKYSITVQVFNSKGQPVELTDIIGNMQTGMQARNELFNIAKDKLSAAGKDYVTYTSTTRRQNMENLICATWMGTGDQARLLTIMASLDPLDPTVRILRNQLIYVSVILIVLAFVISLFISRRMSRPINRMSEAAVKLAKGDFGVVFEKSGSYSEIDSLADTLNYTTGELAKTEELRRELISNVSHDLRTPLTLIKAYAERIRDISGGNAAKRQAHLNVIIEESDRLTALVNDILELSKTQAGMAKLEREDFDIAAALRTIMSRFSILSEQEGYDFTVDSPDSLTVNGDRRKIEQAVYNLVSNAVNYTGEDKRVAVKLADLGGSVRFEVTDSGAGIAPEKLDSIWERYYKGDETHKRAVIGTGLGLSIVRGILVSHGADYGVDSRPGEGSTFWFELAKTQ